MPALDYSRLAAVYDEYCVATADLPFFRSLVPRPGARVLELMAGTGRVSLALLEAGAALTCVDSSPEMLGVLEGKLASRGLVAEVLCADACHLPPLGRFDLVLLPFQGLGELLSRADRRRVMAGASAALAPEGRFVATTHNPPVRLRSVDGRWHELADLGRADGGRLRLSLCAEHDAAAGLVRGRQRIELVAPAGSRVEEIELPLAFALPSADEVGELGAEAGLELESLLGDYAGAPFDEAASPFVVATFRRA